MLTIKTNLQNEKNFYYELGKKYGADTVPMILRSECVAILRAVLKKEKSASSSQLKEIGSRRAFNRFNYPNDEKISINSGRRGGQKNLSWFRLNNKWLPLAVYDGDKSYSESTKKIISDDAKLQFKLQFNSAVRSSRENRKKFAESRGSTAQLWQTAMKKVAEPNDNLDTSASSYIQRAKRLDNKSTSDLVRVTKRGNGKRYSIFGEIDSVILSKNGANFRLAVAIANRQRFFKMAFTKGWVNDAKFFSKTFGGKIKITD